LAETLTLGITVDDFSVVCFVSSAACRPGENRAEVAKIALAAVHFCFAMIEKPCYIIERIDNSIAIDNQYQLYFL
jgi:hypothetical protein